MIHFSGLINNGYGKFYFTIIGVRKFNEEEKILKIDIKGDSRAFEIVSDGYVKEFTAWSHKRINYVESLILNNDEVYKIRHGDCL